MKPWIVLCVFLLTTSLSLKLNHDSGDDYRLCGSGRCIKKCCPEKHVLIKKKCEFSENHEFFFDVFNRFENITGSNISFNVIHDYNTGCTGEILKLSPKFIKSDEFYIQSDGSMFKPFDNVTGSHSFKDYCLETFVFPTREELSALVCYAEDELEQDDEVSYIGEF